MGNFTQIQSVISTTACQNTILLKLNQWLATPQFRTQLQRCTDVMLKQLTSNEMKTVTVDRSLPETEKR
jgi:hypothetical protein